MSKAPPPADLTPAYAEEVAAGVRQIYADAQARVLEAMARAIEKGDGVPEYLEERLNVQRAMIREIDRIMRGLRRGLPSAVREMVALSMNAGRAAASAALIDAGLGTTTGAAAPGLVAASEGMALGGLLAGEVPNTAREITLVRAALEPLEMIPTRVRRWAVDSYAEIGLRAAQEIATGDTTRREASRRLLRRLAEKGITGFTDRAGREWNMNTYAEMVARTTVQQASRAAKEDQLTAAGLDTVIVSGRGSDCDQCGPWENKVLSISGRTVGERLKDGRIVRASLSAARSAGLNHPNCRHSVDAYIPGYTRPRENDAETRADDERARARAQAQRRRLDGLERAAVVAKSQGPAAAAEARAMVKAKRKEISEMNTDSP